MLTLALLTLLAAPANPPVVSLVPSPSPGVPAKRVAALHKRVLELLSDANLQATLSTTSCDSRACLFAVGRAARAQLVVAVGLAGSARETAVDLEAVLVSTGKTVSTSTFGVKVGAEAGPLGPDAANFVEEVNRALAAAPAPTQPDAPLAEVKKPTLEPSPPAQPEVPEEVVSTAGPSRVPLIATTVGAGVAVVVAIVFTALAASKQSEVNAVGPDNTSTLTFREASDKAAQANTSYTVALVSAGVAAALGTTAVVLYATEP